MKKNIITPSILPGFMELLPEDQIVFDDMVYKIREVYERNGCLPIDTPIIEKASVLLAKTGGETEKQVYSFKKGKNDLVLRFDLTVPFARYVSQYINEIKFPFKKYQLGKVYRGERNQRGRYREFYQLDVDVIGRDTLSVKNDAWVISLASQAFKAIGLKNYRFMVSNRKVLKGLMEELEIERSYDVMLLIDKYMKISRDEFISELTDIVGDMKAKLIISMIEAQGSSREIISDLKAMNVANQIFLEGVRELEEVVMALRAFDVDEDEFVVDLKIIRGLDYYTGTVFETLLISNEEFGSVCSGGRYDNLAENYTDNVLPGVGISIGMTRLFYVLKEIGFIQSYDAGSKSEYLIIPIGDTFEYCCEVMKALKSDGNGVSIYLEDAPLKKAMKYANGLGIKNVVLIGEDEKTQRIYKIKNMDDGSELVKGI